MPVTMTSTQTFEDKIESIIQAVQTLRDDPETEDSAAMPGQTFCLENNQILALPRDNGDNRYPYGQEGFNFWVYSSGYMHSNEGLFSHFLRAAEGQEPTIAFFATLPKEKGSNQVIPLLSVPQTTTDPEQPIDRYTLLSPTAAYFVTTLPNLRFVLRVFVSQTQEICFSLQVKNLSDKAQAFSISSYMNPFLRNQIYETNEDRWFKEIQTLPPSPDHNSLGSFFIQINEDKDRLSSVSHYGIIRRNLSLDPGSELTQEQRTTSRYEYVGGARSSLHTPSALAQGGFSRAQSLCTFVDNAIAADLLDLQIQAKQSARLDMTFHYTGDVQQAKQKSQEPIRPSNLDAQWSDLEKADQQRHQSLTFQVDHAQAKIKSKAFNGFFEHLKRQVEFCSLIKGYIQLSPNSLIGIRDVFQALEGLAFWQPQPTREKMLEALGYTAPDGRCFRQYSLPTSTGQMGRMDLRPFIDQGVWVISTIATYLKITGDVAFLDEVCGYHKIIDESTGQVAKSDLQNSVLEHLQKILNYMLEQRDLGNTGCVRALYGDWNDALDGLGITKDPDKDFGTGVSVMATLQVYQNCHEMVDILSFFDANQHAGHIEKYQIAAKELQNALLKFAVVEQDGEKRLLHGWGDERSYMVGSFADPDHQTRDGLTSNAFWVLSGLLQHVPDYKQVILDAYERLDCKYGLKTFEPCFAQDAPGVGRIGKLPPGTAENGATYIHATAFAIMSLFQMGEPQKAWEQLYKILPFTDLHQNLSHSSFVMPNSYGFNEAKQIDGQNMNDWQTGSSNVVFKTFIRYVVGFEPMLEGFWVQPASWIPFGTLQMAFSVRGHQVKINLENNGKNQRVFRVNGQPQEATFDTQMNLQKLWIPYNQLLEQELEILIEQ